MSSARLLDRVPNARAVGSASWPGMRLTCNKVAADGSGKANLVADRDHTAWGVLFEIDQADWIALDGFEPGYTRQQCSLRNHEGIHLAAQVYLANEPFCITPPFDWYRDHLLDGAREFGLPESTVELILSFGTYTP